MPGPDEDRGHRAGAAGRVAAGAATGGARGRSDEGSCSTSWLATSGARRRASIRCARRIRWSSRCAIARGAGRRRAVAHRSDLEPGQSVRRLHRHEAGGFSRASCTRSPRASASATSRCGWAAITSGPMPGGTSQPSPRWRSPRSMIRQYVDGGLSQDPSRLLDGLRAAIPSRCRKRRSPRARAILCAVAERAWREAGGEPPVYVIGTEVPVPGGATEELHELAVTDAARPLRATIDAHRKAFARSGARGGVAARDRAGRAAGRRVRPSQGHRLPAGEGARAERLHRAPIRSSSSKRIPPTTRRRTTCSALVRDHFAILKVGPGATYALRETLWALAAIARELPGGDAEEDLRSRRRRDHARRSAPLAQSLSRCRRRESLDLQYSLSDRIRYYWPHPRVQRACASLLERLRRTPVPLTLLSQYPAAGSTQRCAPDACSQRSMICCTKASRWRCVRTCGRAATESQGSAMMSNGFPGLSAAELEARGAHMDGARDRAAAAGVAAGREARRWRARCARRVSRAAARRSSGCASC